MTATSERRRVSAQEGYRLWAATYDDDPNPLLALEERGLDLLLPSLEGKEGLDVGCGTGRWLRRLFVRGARSVVGVDFTAEMTARAAANPLLRNRLILADCVSLPFRPQIADFIVCSFTVGHVGNIRALARELSRVSRPRAELFVTDLHPEAQARGWRCGFRYLHGSVELEGFVHTQRDTERSFGSEGFNLVGCHDLRLGEPEKPVFARAGKSSFFREACAVPAVVVYHFLLS